MQANSSFLAALGSCRIWRARSLVTPARTSSGNWRRPPIRSAIGFSRALQTMFCAIAWAVNSAPNRSAAAPTAMRRERNNGLLLQLGVNLADEAIPGGRDLLDAGVVFGLRLGGRHFVHRLALLHQFRDLVAHADDHVAVRHHRVALDYRPMARDDL